MEPLYQFELKRRDMLIVMDFACVLPKLMYISQSHGYMHLTHRNTVKVRHRSTTQVLALKTKLETRS